MAKERDSTVQSVLLELLGFSAMLRLFDEEVGWLARTAVFEQGRDELSNAGTVQRLSQLAYNQVQGPGVVSSKDGPFSIRHLNSFKMETGQRWEKYICYDVWGVFFLNL